MQDNGNVPYPTRHQRGQVMSYSTFMVEIIMFQFLTRVVYPTYATYLFTIDFSVLTSINDKVVVIIKLRKPRHRNLHLFL